MNDLAEMLCNGFSLLDHTLRRESEERLIPGLVELWLTAFGNILPCIQAVFLPLDLEFKGLGTILGAREAQEFWGALPGDSSSDRPLGDMLDVRRMVLVAFRDIVILSRYNRLQAVFSRLSLESINGSFDVLSNDSPGSNSGGDTVRGGAGAGRRPDTAASLDPGGSSYNSQSSTLLNDSGGSMGARSRTASNTSSAFGGGGGARASSPATEPVTSPISQYPSTPTAQIPPAPSQRQPAPPPSSSSTHANPSISVPRTSGTSSTIMPARTATMANRPSGPEHAPPPPQPHLPSSQDGTRLTETVGRMLQCVSVLASLRSADEAQDNMEELAKALKHNWLGRGRTGRNRRGFVGTKVVGGRERL
ncbi:MAG: hypothetical protein M1815_005504 [Lichina confinis]|nr:MAG: hypothetical protein M1815_005504 [Lichina confinis]